MFLIFRLPNISLSQKARRCLGEGDRGNMYLIRNISKQELALGDLRLSLKSGQQIDLDTICPRYVAEQSPSLKIFVSKNLIKIVSKDGAGVIETIRETRIVEKDNGHVEILKELKEQEKRLTERQDILIRKHLGEATKTAGLDPQSIAALQTAIAALQNIAGGNALGTAPAVAKPQIEDDGIDEKQSIGIQKRTIERLSKNTQGNIKHEESKSKSNVDSNIDELGDLLQ